MANPTIKVKEGDTHDLVLGVNTLAGVDVDLTGATVRILIRPRGTTDPGQVLTASVTDAAAGEVTHALTGLIPHGAYDLEIEITQGGRITTTPTDGYVTFVVVDDIA